MGCKIKMGPFSQKGKVVIYFLEISSSPELWLVVLFGPLGVDPDPDPTFLRFASRMCRFYKSLLFFWSLEVWLKLEDKIYFIAKTELLSKTIS